MPTSNYESIHLSIREKDGTISHIAGATVKVRNTVTNADIATLTTDGSGEIVAGTLSVDPGTRVIFRVENYNGRAVSKDYITT